MTLPHQRERVLVAMSGGVDSSVVAALLLEQGYDVLGATLQLNPCEDRTVGRSCCGVDSALAAREVARQLGIEHALFDCRRQFEEDVLRPAWSDYREGRTPSPCLLCNQRIKFGFLMERARRLGASRVATGHYARIVSRSVGGELQPTLRRATDRAKDQSYFLAALSREQLRRALFPLGELEKPQVRDLARRFGLSTAERPDSQDACLGTGENGFAEALSQRFDEPMAPGPLVDDSGRTVGTHQGLHRYTIGQRRGLGGELGGRTYVRALDATRNRVLLTREPAQLMASEVRVALFEPLCLDEPPGTLHVQLRSRHSPTKCSARLLDDRRDQLLLTLERPQRAITPGQAAVLYDEGEHVIAGGWISPSAS